MVDLTGKRFGNLTVVSYANNYKWNCLCDCGANKIIRGGDLQSGKTKSCGCLKKENAARQTSFGFNQSEVRPINS